MPIHNRPIFTDIFDGVSDFSPDPKSVYISGCSVEARSEHLNVWKGTASDVSFVDITLEERTHVNVALSDGSEQTIALRSSDQISRFWERIKQRTIYLDITGLRHHVWAALLRGALETREHVVVIYVEPSDYRPSVTPTENEIYDLSERIEGISPLPGFAR